MAIYKTWTLQKEKVVIQIIFIVMYVFENRNIKNQMINLKQFEIQIKFKF
jgi:hypothetical protein